MLPTPPIPDWIRSFRAKSYTNIYQLQPDETRLYGTESLYGDWDAQLLLLAKDFAPSRLIHKRIDAGEARPYHHTDWIKEPCAPGAATNRNLHHLAHQIAVPKLYGSALAGLLRDDGKVSGSLADMTELGQFISEVLNFTIRHMPNLRAIACLGADAWSCATAALGCPDADWRQHREARQPLTVNGTVLFALAHPSRMPGGKTKVQSDWDAMARAIDGATNAASAA
jgi:hypothetical protein